MARVTGRRSPLNTTRQGGVKCQVALRIQNSFGPILNSTPHGRSKGCNMNMTSFLCHIILNMLYISQFLTLVADATSFVVRQTLVKVNMLHTSFFFTSC